MRLFKKPIITILIFLIVFTFSSTTYAFSLFINNNKKHSIIIDIFTQLFTLKVSSKQTEVEQPPEVELPEIKLDNAFNISDKSQEIFNEVTNNADNKLNTNSLRKVIELIEQLVSFPLKIKDVFGNMKNEYSIVSYSSTNLVKTAIVKSIDSKGEEYEQTISKSQQLAKLCCVPSSLENLGPIAIADAKLNGQEITLIVLQGTEVTEGQATGILEDLQSGFGQSNAYLETVVKLFQDDKIIPKDKPIFVTGISLGGMVAQQLLAQKGDYLTFIGAHSLGYITSKCWSNFDVLGVENGNSSLTFGRLTYYEANR